MFDDVHTRARISLLTDAMTRRALEADTRSHNPARWRPGVVVGLRPNLRQRGVSAHGGDRRGQWNHARTIPNNLEWHIDIGRGSRRPTAAPAAHNRE